MKWILGDGRFALGATCGALVSLVLMIAFSVFEFPLINDRAILGAIVGGFISGLVAVISVLLAIADNSRRRENEEKKRFETGLFSVFSRLNQILDDVTKAYRHQLSGDERSSVFFLDPEGGSKKELRKPLSGIKEIVRFTDSEKILPLEIKDAPLFNMIAHAERVSESLYFLQQSYETVFNDLQTALLAQESISVQGKTISGEVEVKKTELLRIMDLNNHLYRLLMEARPEIKLSHDHVRELLRAKCGRSVRFEEDPTVTGGVFGD